MTNYKKILGILGLTLIFPALSFGQQGEQPLVENHSDTISIKKRTDNFQIKIYKKTEKEAITDDEKTSSNDATENLNKDDNSLLDVLPFVPQKKTAKHFDANYPFFYLGFGRGSSNAMSYSSHFPQRTGKSVDWGFNIYNSEIQLDKQAHWGLTWAVGFAYTRHVFDANSGLEKVDGNIIWTPAPENVDYQKSWLRYWSFRIPINIEWQKKIKGSYLYLSAGPEVEFRYAMKSKVKYDGHDHTLTSNPNANVIGANLMVQAGYGCLSFIGRFGLTPLMDKDRAPHYYHSSIGFGIHF